MSRDLLRCFAIEQPRQWSCWIPWAEFWYNTNFHIFIGTTPFEAVYGRKPPTMVQHILGEIKVEVVAREFRDRDEALRQLKHHLTIAQEQMRRTANAHWRDIQFDIDDWVYLKLRPHRHQSQRINQKLAPHYYRPFQIEKKCGPMAYKLTLPSNSKVHPVFHVSLLKRAVATQTINVVLPAEFSIEEVDIFTPHQILAHHSIKQQGVPIKEFLIQWHNKPVEEATWEDEFLLKSRFLGFSLEDKTVFDFFFLGGGGGAGG